MAKTREIKNRMKAVSNIKRITRTMQLIATAKFQAASRRATRSRPYTDKVAELVGELAGAAGGEGGAVHPLLSPPAEKTGRELMLVITSTRGLCGGYNANILRTASKFITERPDTRFDIDVVGKKGVSYFNFRGFTVANTYLHFGDTPPYAEVCRLADEYIEKFTAGEYDAVRVAYMRFITNARQTPEVLKLLPLSRPESDESPAAPGVGTQTIYEFDPAPEQLLDELLPVSVRTQLFQCFNDAIVSEQIARMIAMKSATDNADQMGKSLTRQYNRARQAQITTELTEIISGAAALE